MIMMLRQICRNLGKALLNSLSIAISVSMVLIICGLSNYGLDKANKMLDSVGIGGFIISSNINGVFDSGAINFIKSCNHVTYATPTLTEAGSNGDNIIKIHGVGPDAQQLYSFTTAYGRFISQTDVSDSVNCCVISRDMSKKYFGNDNGVGLSINVFFAEKSERFTVIGIVETDEMLSNLGIVGNEQYEIFVPYSTLCAIAKTSVKDVSVITDESISAEQNGEQIRLECEEYFGTSAITVENVAAEREQINTVMSLISLVLRLIAGISVLVSVCGLMVIMILNVRSRTAEIGLKKSLGASDKSVMLEIIAESGATAIVGSIVGVAFYFVSGLIMSAFQISISAGVGLIVAIPLISIVSAMLFSIIPGFIAAKTEPAVALKK